MDFVQSYFSANIVRNCAEIDQAKSLFLSRPEVGICQLIISLFFPLFFEVHIWIVCISEEIYTKTQRKEKKKIRGAEEIHLQ